MYRKITKGLEQIILQEFQIITILENPSKDDLRWFNLTTLPKKTPSRLFFWGKIKTVYWEIEW